MEWMLSSLREDPRPLDFRSRIYCVGAVATVRLWLGGVVELISDKLPAEQAAQIAYRWSDQEAPAGYLEQLVKLTGFIESARAEVKAGTWWVNGSSNAERMLIGFHLSGAGEHYSVLTSVQWNKLDNREVAGMVCRRHA